jgi:hypothetical protein
LETQSGDTYRAALRELGESAKDILINELNLLRAEMEESLARARHYGTEAAVFAGIAAASIFPFMAFLVIGLGQLLDGRYWLSSLIVAVVFAAIGIPLAIRAFRKIADLDLPRTRQTLQREKTALRKSARELKHAVTGGSL